jgi:Predicted Fe-S oxidoreductases
MNNNKSKIDLRPNELTGIIGRDSMDLLRDLIGVHRWDEYRLLYDQLSRLEVETDFPIQLDFELNASCNLKCPMCPLSAETNKGKGRNTWFEFDDYKKILDEGITKGLRAVKLNYINEPFIRDDIVDFIDYANKIGVVDIYLSTNGLLLNKTVMEQFIKAGLTRIQISIDATTESTYNLVRPGGNFERVINNIETLINIKKKMSSLTPLIRVNFVRTELNESELESFVDYWIDKVDMIGIQEMVKPPISSKNVGSKTTQDKRQIGFKCSFPYKQLVINNEGDILPCCTFYGEQLKLGNIKSNTISEIWKSDKIKNLRKIHKEGQYYLNEVCKKCVEDSVIGD